MFYKAACLALGLIAAASRVNAETRIVGGTPTTIYNYPFVVSIIDQSNEDDVQRCVGSLISSWHVLTTAYCFNEADVENLIVRAGSTNSLEGGTVVKISEVIIHPDYVIKPRTADIAITVLTEPLALTDSIRVVYIPPQQTDIPDGYSVKALGWGYESESSETDRLMVIDTNTISQEQCSEAYDEDEAVSVYDQVMCTLAENTSMCSEDTGAPLILNVVLVGLSSYHGTCDSSTPDVFTRVDRHTGWILEHAVAPSLVHGAVPVRVARV